MIGRPKLELPGAVGVLFSALCDPWSREELTSSLSRLDNDGWRALTKLAIERHRVGPRVWVALKAVALDRVPPDIAKRFDAEARQAGIRALAAKAETMRVLFALNKHGIEPVLLKGWALEEDLFGRIGQRVTHDLDVLVEPRELAIASESLQVLGYVSPMIAVLKSDRRRNFFLRFDKDFTFGRAHSQPVIELHARLLVNWKILPLEVLSTQPRNLKLNGVAARYRVFAPRSNFLYLAIHGYLHRWERAKWLIDIPPLLQRLSDPDWRYVCEHADELGVGRTLGVGLVLSRDLLKVDIPAAAQHLVAQADNSFAAAVCRRHLLATEMSLDQPTLRRWLESYAVQLCVSKRWTTFSPTITSKLVQPSDISASDLPDKFLFLQYALSALKWPWRLGRNTFTTLRKWESRGHR